MMDFTVGQSVPFVKDSPSIPKDRSSRHAYRMAEPWETCSESEFRKRFKRRLIDFREAAGISSAQMASKLDIEHPAYIKYEQFGTPKRSGTLPPLRLIPKIAKVLNCSVWFLLTGRQVEEHLVLNKTERSRPTGSKGQVA